jgi:hypothetical protein
LSENTPATPKSPTPILDRQSPLPALAPRGYSAGLLVGLLICIVIALSTAATFWQPLSILSVRQHLTAIFPELFPARWTVAAMVSFGLMAILVAFAAVAVHELGHVLGGLCAGFRFNSLRIGPLLIHRGFRISQYRGWGAWLGGAAQVIPIAS